MAVAGVPRALTPPWQTYEKLLDSQLGECDYFAIAERKHPDVEGSSVVIIKTFTGLKAERHVQAIRGIHHNRFVSPGLSLTIDDGFPVSFDFMPMALCEVVGNTLLRTCDWHPYWGKRAPVHECIIIPVYIAADDRRTIASRAETTTTLGTHPHPFGYLNRYSPWR